MMASTPPCEGTIGASGTSGTFTPARYETPDQSAPFNIFLDGTFEGTVRLQRKPSGSVVWYDITADGESIYQWTLAGTFAISEAVEEPEAGVAYRLNVVRTSGSVNYRMSA